MESKKHLTVKKSTASVSHCTNTTITATPLTCHCYWIICATDLRLQSLKFCLCFLWGRIFAVLPFGPSQSLGYYTQFSCSRFEVLTVFRNFQYFPSRTLNSHEWTVTLEIAKNISVRSFQQGKPLCQNSEVAQNTFKPEGTQAQSPSLLVIVIHSNLDTQTSLL